MEVVLNLCANGEAVHKNHGRKAWCAHGHEEKTTKVVIGKRLYSPEMKQDVEHFVHTSVKCQNTIYIQNEIWAM
jgi:hypothetical protein